MHKEYGSRVRFAAVLVGRITVDKADKLKRFLESRGFEFQEKTDHLLFAKAKGATLHLYKTGSVVVDAKDELLEAEIRFFLEEHGLEVPPTDDERFPLPHISGTRIGSDESGKGDYFGPLVVCAAMVTEPQAAKLRSIGVKDSKKLGETTISNLAVEIRKILLKPQYEVIQISPVRYNLMFAQKGNANKILGWAHARALEVVTEFREPCKVAIADQFGDKRYIEEVLEQKGVDIQPIQVPKAEREISVAAASILARDQYLRAMEEMAEEYGEQFPRGATHVEDFAVSLAKRYGPGVLLATAKVHFAITQRVLGSSSALRDTLVEVQQANKEAAPLGKERAEHRYLEVFSIFSSFEKDLRSFIERELQKKYGNEWWEKGVPPHQKAAAESLRLKEANRGRNPSLMECLYFPDYDAIIRKANWDIFSRVFEDQELFLARFRTLADLRNPVAHSRGFTRHDKMTCLGNIGWFRQKMIEYEQELEG